MKFEKLDEKKLDNSEIEKIQNINLNKHLDYLFSNSIYYKKIFKLHSIKRQHIKSVDDFKNTQVFTTKKDIQDNNDAFIAVPGEDITDIVMTSGTTGTPIKFYQTNNDLNRLAYNEYLSFKVSGIRNYDIAQLALTLDRNFIAGMAYFLGLKMLGSGITRVGSGFPAMQLKNIDIIKPTVIVGVPSFLARIAEFAKAENKSINDTSIKKAVCIGEPLRNRDFSLNEVGKKLKRLWDIEIYSTFASTETSSTFCECKYGQGGHHHPQLCIAEIVDKDGINVEPGMEGELVVTPLGIEGTPLFRYKTGDITFLEEKSCKCGLKTMRIGPIIGRKEQMIKLKGTTIFPESIFNILNGIETVSNYIIYLKKDNLGLDNVIIEIGTNIKITKHIKNNIKEKLRSALRVIPDIKYKSASDIDKTRFGRGSRKPVKFIDQRN